MERREFLVSAAAAGAVALAGCSGNREGEDREPPPPPATDGWEPRVPDRTAVPTGPSSVADEWGFENAVDLRAADVGEMPLDEALAEYVAEDTLVTLPPGRYRLEDEFVLDDDVSRFGIAGERATIVPAEGFSGVLLGLGYPDPLDELFVSGLTFDFRAPETGGRPLLAKADDRLLVSDVSVTGAVDVDQDLLRFDVTDADGSGVVQRVSLPDGAPTGFGNTGMEVGDDTHGDIDFVDCHVAGFPDNGLYADPPEGSVRVLGGSYLNNGVAGVRVEADEALVQGVHVRCDSSEGGENMRGIRLRGGRSVLVEHCLVELLDVTTSDGAVTFSSALRSGTVRNCRLRVDADGVNAVRIKSAESEASAAGPFTVEDVVVSGDASGGAGVQAANREGCTFRNVCIHQSGDDRDGITADNVEGELHDVYVSVTGDPLRAENSRLERSSVTLRSLPASHGGGGC